MVRRAPRFLIQIPLRYRPSGETAWRQGQTRNISRSGLLFQVEQLLGVDTPLEITFVLPGEVGGKGGAEVFCEGQVVRAALSSAKDAPVNLAARILAYGFMRSEGEEVPVA